jgi:hypothetical protein
VCLLTFVLFLLPLKRTLGIDPLSRWRRPARLSRRATAADAATATTVPSSAG